MKRYFIFLMLLLSFIILYGCDFNINQNDKTNDSYPNMGEETTNNSTTGNQTTNNPTTNYPPQIIEIEDNIELSTNETHIVWKYIFEQNWKNLISFESLKNENSVSAYELYIASHPEYNKTEEQWNNDLFDGKLDIQVPQCIISFDINGDARIQNVAMTNDQLTNQNRDGYICVGWYTTSDVHNDSQQNSPNLYSDMTLYMTLVPINYTITYYLNGGVNNTSNPISYNIETNAIKFNNPTRNGYEFLGWYLDAAFTKPIGKLDRGSHGDVSLYAKWSKLITCADDITQDKCQDPATWDWEYNRSGFDGKGIQILILSGAPESLDPFRNDYTGGRRGERRAQLNNIQNEYNVQIIFDKYPLSAAWGPDRIAWINNLSAQNIVDQGDVFAINSDWIPSLVGGKSIAELASYSTANGQRGGIFGELGYEQTAEKNKLYRIGGKVYGYSYGKVHADAFLYYNQDLVDEYNLEDPATLWNQGKWDWTTFYSYLETAQQAFDASGYDEKTYAFGGAAYAIPEYMLSARGGKFVDVEMQRVLFTNQKTLDLYTDLRKIYNNIGWAPSSITTDVSNEFQNGHQLFTHGYLWYLSSAARFNQEQITFPISLVPYPTADGDASAREHYTIPIGSDDGYVFRKVENGTNGLTTQVLVNIIDDYFRGLGPDYSTIGMTEEQVYIAFLQMKIKSAQSIQAVMSVESNVSNYGYIDYLWVLSKAVGNGSDWQSYGFNTWCIGLINRPDDPAIKLAQMQPIYQDKLYEILASDE